MTEPQTTEGVHRCTPVALEIRVDRIERLLALLYTENLEAGWSYNKRIRAIIREIAGERADAKAAD